MSISDLYDVIGTAKSIIVDCLGEHEQPVHVLEAGGGSSSWLNIPNVKITTIDISEDELARNDYANTKVCADLHEWQPEVGQYDIIVCFDVLEHLYDPMTVLQKFAPAIKSGGIIYLACPNGHSLEGMITKYTPHWCHKLIHKHFLRFHPGYVPFKTYMRRAMLPEQLREFFVHMNMDVLYYRLYERERRDRFRALSPRLGYLYDAAIAVCRLTGWQQVTDTDCVILLRA